MFRAIMTSCSLAVRTMRACPPRAGGLEGPLARPGKQGGLGRGTPPNVQSDNLNFPSLEVVSNLVMFVTVFN